MLLSFVSYQPIFAQFDERLQGRSVEIPSIEPAADGWVGFCTVTRQQWSDFTVMIERPELGEDDSLAHAPGRMARYDEVHEAITAWTTTRTVAEIVELASLFRIPVSAVGDGRTVTEMEQFVERGVYVASPAGFLQPRRPYRLGVAAGPAPIDASPRARRARRRGPGVGRRRRGAPALPEAAVAPRPLEGLKVVAFVAFWAGPVRRLLPRRAGRRRGEDRVDPAARRHALRRRREARRPADVRVVGRHPRGQRRAPGHHPRPRPARRASTWPSGSWPRPTSCSTTSRPGCSTASASARPTCGQVRARPRHGPHARLRPRRPVAATAAGSP